MAASSIVVRMPAEIDLTSATAIGEELAQAVGSGVRIVVADLSATTFCDSTAILTLLTAAGAAAASGAELRLVIADGGPVRRIIDIMRLGRVLSIYPTLAAALVSR